MHYVTSKFINLSDALTCLVTVHGIGGVILQNEVNEAHIFSNQSSDLGRTADIYLVNIASRIGAVKLLLYPHLVH